MKNILFIVNPKAGIKGVNHLKHSIQKYLDLTQFNFTITHTSYAKHAIVLAQQAVQDKVDIVVAIGGDGTINEVAQALIGTNTTLAIIPKGSGNGLARELNIPFRLKQALQLINNGKKKGIDVALVNQQIMLSNFGIGFTASIASKIQKSSIRGIWPYIKHVSLNFITYKPQHYRLNINNKTTDIHAFLIVVANAKQFGYNFHIAEHARIDDQLLEVVIIEKFKLWQIAPLIFKIFRKRLSSSKLVKHFTANFVIIDCIKQVDYQIDGEYINNHQDHYEISMHPQPLNIIIP